MAMTACDLGQGILNVSNPSQHELQPSRQGLTVSHGSQGHCCSHSFHADFPPAGLLSGLLQLLTKQKTKRHSESRSASESSQSVRCPRNRSRKRVLMRQAEAVGRRARADYPRTYREEVGAGCMLQTQQFIKETARENLMRLHANGSSARLYVHAGLCRGHLPPHTTRNLHLELR
eukprot:6177071-Pleurochrysis_carterae.AAC.3